MNGAVPSVVVVGGGIAGMCAAISLARIGFKVDLVEEDAEWRALGAGVSLNGSTLRAFHRMGLLPRIAAHGHCSDVRRIHHADGRLVYEASDANAYGVGIPNVGGILRPALHAILQEATRHAGASVHLGCAAERVDCTPESASVTLTGGRVLSADFVIGADGVGSTLRRQLFPDAPAPRYSGQGCWRAVVSRPREIIGPTMFMGRQMVGINPVSASQMYLFLLENLPEKTWIDPSQWLQRLRAQLQEFGGTIAQVREELSESSLLNYRPLETYVMPDPWFRERVLLIGDAAHATTPHAAFGAGLGVEDALVLAELATESTELPSLFERFMRRRYQRCASIVAGTVNLGELELRHVPVEEFARATARVQGMIRELP